MHGLARWIAGATSFAASLVFVTGCGCADDPDSWEPGRPRIDRLEYLQESPGDPLALEWSITFTDSDGDLSTGTLHLLVDDQEAGTRALSEVFESQVPPLDPHATQGTLEVVVKLQAELPAGQKVKIGFVLEEGEGDCARSNEPYVVLQALMPGGG